VVLDDDTNVWMAAETAEVLNDLRTMLAARDATIEELNHSVNGCQGTVALLLDREGGEVVFTEREIMEHPIEFVVEAFEEEATHRYVVRVRYPIRAAASVSEDGTQ
jgi:hypothetical protein